MNSKQDLIIKAFQARESAYAPYSGFRVGCALRTTKGIYVGCNVENASYGLTICAERAAICNAVSGGALDILELAVCGYNTRLIISSGESASDTKTASICAPCGACRQFIAEVKKNLFFQFSKGCNVIMASSVSTFTERSIEELLPFSFEANLKK